MTIHSDWSRVLHEECPTAFLRGGKPPKGPKYGVGVIDGHLQLMRLHGGLPSWDAFVDYLFLRPIARLFEAGCPVVVLCFDSYDSVPQYKSMTQKARAGAHSVQPFEAGDELPERVPADAMQFLLNRNFKLKLIEMLCTKVPQRVPLAAGQRLVLDYKRVVQFEADDNRLHPQPLALPDGAAAMQPMGESDVKFCRYVTLFGNALVHAIDGDYLAIALLYYARHGLRADNKIFLYRHLATLHKAPAASAGAKRKKKSEEEGKSWVDMQMLFTVVAGCLRSSTGVRPLDLRTQQPFADGDVVRSGVFLMLAAGTDFSRGLPLLGPRRIWDVLPDIVVPLLQAAGGAVPDCHLFAHAVVGRLYGAIFARHARAATGLDAVLGALGSSALSETTKGRLPSREQVLVTARNVAWVMAYWGEHNGSVETPLQGQCGFSAAASGAIHFSDLPPPAVC